MKTRPLEKLEEEVLELFVMGIRDSTDPVDQFKMIERYQAFVAARSDRIRSEAAIKTEASSS